MYIALIIIHVIVCLVLIATILLQAGRGAGLNEMFGGESAQSVLGTQAPAILKKATTVCAIAFLLTSLILGMVTARRGRSLFMKGQLPAMPVSQALPQQPGEDVVQPKMPVSVDATGAKEVAQDATDAAENAAQPEADAASGVANY